MCKFIYNLKRCSIKLPIGEIVAIKLTLLISIKQKKKRNKAIRQTVFEIKIPKYEGSFHCLNETLKNRLKIYKTFSNYEISIKKEFVDFVKMSVFLICETL